MNRVLVALQTLLGLTGLAFGLRTLAAGGASAWLAWGPGWLLVAGYNYRNPDGWREATAAENVALVCGGALVVVSAVLLGT